MMFCDLSVSFDAIYRMLVLELYLKTGKYLRIALGSVVTIYIIIYEFHETL